MLNLGMSELLLVVVAAILFIGPKDYPVVMRQVSKAIREFKALTGGLKAQMQDVAREAGLEDIKQQARTIIDLDGKEQVAYDVAELDQLKAKRDE